MTGVTIRVRGSPQTSCSVGRMPLGRRAGLSVSNATVIRQCHRRRLQPSGAVGATVATGSHKTGHADPERARRRPSLTRSGAATGSTLVSRRGWFDFGIAGVVGFERHARAGVRGSLNSSASGVITAGEFWCCGRASEDGGLCQYISELGEGFGGVAVLRPLGSPHSEEASSGGLVCGLRRRFYQDGLSDVHSICVTMLRVEGRPRSRG